MDIELLPNQQAILSHPAKLRLAAGGVGGGKTFCGTIYALDQAVNYPDALGLIAANTYAQLAKSTIYPLTRILDGMGILWAYGKRPRWPCRHSFVDYGNVLSIGNGSSILCYSAERPEVILGITIGWAWLDETRDTSLEFWQNVQSRIRDSKGSGRTFVTTTPCGRSHWLHERFIDEEKRLPDSQYVTLRTRENSHLPDGYYDGLLKDLGTTLAQQELEGAWIQLNQGLVFEFDRTKSMKPCVVQPGLPLILSMDSNVQPMGGVVMQIDARKRAVWILDEIAIADNALTKRAGEIFAEKFAGWRGDVLLWVDVTSLKRDTRGGDADINILKNTLRPIFPSAREGSDRRQRFVLDGVCACNALMNPALGDVRLFVDPKCKELIADFETTTWIEGVRKIDKTNPKRGHWCDSARYPISQLLPVMSSGVVTCFKEPGVSRFL